MIENANECYRFEEINYEESILETIDVAYVIHLEGNGRLQNIKDQLNKFKPCKKCIIVYNKGFKNCNKSYLKKQSANYDLADANIKVMEDAKSRNLNNVMVLEDDFFFDDNIINHKNNVDSFIKSKEDKNMIYFIGYIPGVVLPYDYYNFKILMGGMTHCVIYNKKTYLEMLKNPPIFDIDIYYLKYNCYMYYKPLCYQLFPETENSKNWSDFGILMGILKILNMNKNHKPGYDIIYFFAKYIILITILIIVMLLYVYLKK